MAELVRTEHEDLAPGVAEASVSELASAERLAFGIAGVAVGEFGSAERLAPGVAGVAVGGFPSVERLASGVAGVAVAELVGGAYEGPVPGAEVAVAESVLAGREGLNVWHDGGGRG